MQLSHVLWPTDASFGSLYYLIFQNLVIFSEGEHLNREAFDVGWDCNPGIAHNRMEDGHIAVITVLTASKRNINKIYLN